MSVSYLVARVVSASYHQKSTLMPCKLTGFAVSSLKILHHLGLPLYATLFAASLPVSSPWLILCQHTSSLLFLNAGVILFALGASIFLLTGTTTSLIGQFLLLSAFRFLASPLLTFPTVFPWAAFFFLPLPVFAC
jgi:hypothetical protein